MKNCLLSIDWDYFIYTQKDNWGSYLENKKALVNLWYKRYLQLKADGRDIKQLYKLAPETETFWTTVKKHFRFTEDTKAFVSDSHALSYDIAKELSCETVYSFDAHSDLGYGGLSSLNFEVNCSNWLGKLLKENISNEADIIYSPYTVEKPEYFKQINNNFNVRYLNIKDLISEIHVSAVHICRSGAWTPPWLDASFTDFINKPGVVYEIKSCPERKWDTAHMSFSDQLNYLMA